MRCGVQEVGFRGWPWPRLIDSLPGISFKGIMSHQMMSRTFIGPGGPGNRGPPPDPAGTGPAGGGAGGRAAGGDCIHRARPGATTWPETCPKSRKSRVEAYLVMETGYEYMPDFHFRRQGAEHGHKHAQAGGCRGGCGSQGGWWPEGPAPGGGPPRALRRWKWTWTARYSGWMMAWP